MATTKKDVFAAVAAQEELLSAACAATAHWVPDAEAELHALAAAHLATSASLGSRPSTWLTVHATLRATLMAAMSTAVGALAWLRRQEQRLIDCYVALEGQTALSPSERQRLRRTLVPAAFERFGRVDRWIMLREEQGVFA